MITNQDLDELEQFASFDCGETTGKQICELIEDYKRLRDQVNSCTSCLNEVLR